MAATAEFFSIHKIVWWADYGTLLGAVRNPMTTWSDYYWLPQENRPFGPLEPGIVPHDKDGDLGVEWAAWPTTRASFGRFLESKGFHRYMNASRHSMKARLSLTNTTNIDLFFWRESTGRMSLHPKGMMYRDRYAAVDKGKGKAFHRDMLYPLSTVEWEGMILPAPRDPEAFLEFRYGPTWRTPLPGNSALEAEKAGLGSIVGKQWVRA